MPVAIAIYTLVRNVRRQHLHHPDLARPGVVGPQYGWILAHVAEKPLDHCFLMAFECPLLQQVGDKAAKISATRDGQGRCDAKTMVVRAGSRRIDNLVNVDTRMQFSRVSQVGNKLS